MSPKLTLQINEPEHGWLDAAELAFQGTDQVRIEYDIDFVSAHLGRHDQMALSVTWPVGLDTFRGRVPGFILDLLPQGKALQRLLARHRITDERDYARILSTVALASPGNIRIREPWEPIERQRPSYTHPGFARDEIIQANVGFVEYMEDHGAPVGGTSGAAGGAPKFLLREDMQGRFHADGYLDDSRTKQAWLIKFPFSDSANSRLLVRAEKSYYDVLRQLPLDTSAPLEIHNDILFIPRFDRIRMPDGRLHYFGLESFYSAHGIHGYGMPLHHEDNLQLIRRYSSDYRKDVLEYLKRDIVNQALSNTDNHGRNTSFIKKSGVISLSPVYDVTAMRFFEGDFIVPLTRWTRENSDLKRVVHWVVSNLGLTRDEVVASLKDLYTHLQGLEDLLHNAGTPAEIIRKSADDRREVIKNLAEL